MTWSVQALVHLNGEPTYSTGTPQGSPHSYTFCQDPWAAVAPTASAGNKHANTPAWILPRPQRRLFPSGGVTGPFSDSGSPFATCTKALPLAPPCLTKPFIKSTLSASVWSLFLSKSSAAPDTIGPRHHTIVSIPSLLSSSVGSPVYPGAKKRSPLGKPPHMR